MLVQQGVYPETDCFYMSKTQAAFSYPLTPQSEMECRQKVVDLLLGLWASCRSVPGGLNPLMGSEM